MNITLENIDELNAVLTMKIEKEDYTEKVDKVLREHRRKANMPGFRQGKVPMSLIKKMYGKAVMADEINKIISEKLMKHIQDEKIDILGEPLPSNDQTTAIDFDNQEEFEFKFDLGLYPEFELDFSDSNLFPFYKIKVEDELIDKTIEELKQQFGANENVDIVEGEEIIKGNIYEVNSEGNQVEDGIMKDDVMLSLKVMKDEEEKNKFIGANKNQLIRFNLKKALPNNAEIASLLGIEKEVAEKFEADVEIEIKEIQRFKKADLNEELYKKVFANQEEEVTTFEAFREKVEESLKTRFDSDSEFKFGIDAKNKLIEETKMPLPEEFLKRWLLVSNQEKDKELTKEKVEKDFPYVIKDIKWQLIKNRILKDGDVNLNEDDIKQAAKNYTSNQMAQYGMSHGINDIMLNQFADEMLKNDETRRDIIEARLEQSVTETLRTKVKLEEKEVTSDEYNKIVEEDNKKVQEEINERNEQLLAEDTKKKSDEKTESNEE